MWGLWSYKLIWRHKNVRYGAALTVWYRLYDDLPLLPKPCVLDGSWYIVISNIYIVSTCWTILNLLSWSCLKPLSYYTQYWSLNAYEIWSIVRNITNVIYGLFETYKSSNLMNVYNLPRRIITNFAWRHKKSVPSSQ